MTTMIFPHIEDGEIYIGVTVWDDEKGPKTKLLHMVDFADYWEGEKGDDETPEAHKRAFASALRRAADEIDGAV